MKTASATFMASGIFRPFSLTSSALPALPENLQLPQEKNRANTLP